MTSTERLVKEPSESPAESLVRFSRRSLVSTLVVVLALGAAALGMTLWPDGAVSRFMARASWVVPIAIVILAAALRSTLRGRRWDPSSREAKAILQDELRQASLNRASRAVLAVVLIAQLPLALLLGALVELPALRTALAMSEASITLGMCTLISLFLFFDRE